MQRFTSPPRAPSKAPNIPTILISDYTVRPITTTHYISHANELSFATIYTRIKSLLLHPQCAHRPTASCWPCAPCESSFSTAYWTCAAFLLDYFADFLPHDTPLMRDTWFHLLDIWQQSISFFPVASALATTSVAPDAVQAYTQARWLSKHVSDTLALMDTVIHGLAQKNVPRQPLIHNPTGEYETGMGTHNTGPWISGLRPWQQFLCAGGPGVAGEDDEQQKDNKTCYIPLAGINILKTHTARARTCASKLTPNADDMALFDDRCIKFPAEAQTRAQAHSYKALSGATVGYYLTDGAPPVMRHRGYAQIERECQRPTLSVLDEFVGVCRRAGLFYPVSGGGGEGDEGGGDEEEEEEEDGEMQPFDVWVVTEGKRGGGGGEKGKA